MEFILQYFIVIGAVVGWVLCGMLGVGIMVAHEKGRVRVKDLFTEGLAIIGLVILLAVIVSLASEALCKRFPVDRIGNQVIWKRKKQ